MPKVQNSNEPWSREIYAEPIHAFERGGSEVSFDNKTFTCVYVNFVQLAIQNNPFYVKIISQQRLRTVSVNVIYVTDCNM